MNTNFVKSLLVIGMGLSLAACSSNDPEPKKEDTKVVEAKKEEKKELSYCLGTRSTDFYRHCLYLELCNLLVCISLSN